MRFKPLGKRVLLKREELENKTKSGIFLPTANTEKPSYGKIVAVSEELKDHKELKLNAYVAFKEYKTNEFKIDNVEYLIVDYDDLLGVVEK